MLSLSAPLSLLLALALGLPPRPTAAGADSVRSDADVHEVALRHAEDVQRCYESEGLRRNPALVGTLELELVVLPTGVVDSVRVDASTLDGPGDEEVARCLTVSARNWRFSRGPYDVEAIVFPFHFAPVAAEPVRPAART